MSRCKTGHQYHTPLRRSAYIAAGMKWFFHLCFAAIIFISTWSYAASIPSNVTINFNSSGFVETADHGSNVFTQGDFKITYSAGNWFQDTDDGEGSSAALFAGVFSGVETITIETTSGNEFDFASFYINAFGGGFVSIQGFRNGLSVGTQTSGTGFGQASGTFTITPNNTPFDNVDRVIITSNPGGFYDIFDSFVFNTVPDTTPPTVTSVSVPANSTYITGNTLSFTVNTSENVLVTTGGGTPRIALTIGATTKYATYSSGSGSSALVFSYTVESDLLDSDGIAVGALGLNGGTLKDAANNDMTLTLNSVGSTTNVLVDSTAPTVSGVTSTTANGTYKIGDVISVQVNFSETVTVNTGGGTPQLTLETGATDRVVNYSSGSGTSTLTFNYTVQSGDLNADLDYVATSSLALNGGTIRDAAGNNATLTLASPGAANSLGANKALVVDGVVPSVSSTAPAGGAVSADTSVNFTVNFSETVSNISTDDFALGTTGTAAGTIASVSASSGSSVTVTVSGITGNGSIKLNLNGATNIQDAAGNSSPAAYTSGTTHTVAIPTPPGAPTIGAVVAGDGQVSVSFTAPVNNGGSAITGYTVTSNPAGITAGGNGFTTSPITVTGLTNGQAYTFTVTATNAIGTSNASGASGSAIPMGNQTITFTNPGPQNFGTTPTLSATATSSLTVSFSSSTTGVCTITSGGALTFVTAGSCTIDADQAGDSVWNAASTVSRTFTVNAIAPGAPTIGTATAGNTAATVTFTAPASNGGTSITGYTVTANPGGLTGTGAGSPITVTGLTNGVPYTFTVTATNAAPLTGAASAASNSVTPKAPQTITFANPGTQTYNTAPNLSVLGGGASSTSGLTVTFTSSTTGVCTITSGGVLTFVTAGTCTINADQAGDSSFLPATQVSRSFTVNPVVAGAPTIGTATAGDTQVSVAFTAPTDNGGATITGYTVTVNPADVAPVNGASSPIVVTGLTNGQPYTFTVTADNVAGTGPASSASNSATPKATQTVTFNNPGPQNFGTTPTFSANSDSGLQPTFTSSTTGVCTITSGGAVTFVTAGTCTINADQPGNGSYLAATQVTRSFAVNAVVPGAPTIGTATAGNAQASVTFTAPAFTGGAAITSYTVTANPGGATASGVGSPITVAGLNNGTGYTFSVTATNSVGTGLASAASNFVAPNAPPVIGGTPATSVAEGTAYSFTPTANDSVGDVLTFGITNKPSWASFNAATGALTGTPTNADVGTTTGIVISVSDGSLSASLAAFNLTVTNVNDAPVISGTPTTSVAQDAAYSFMPTVTDEDIGDVMTFSITNKPSWASFDTATGMLTGTPTNADVGTTTGIVISVNDGTATVSLAAFNIVVTNVNEAPVISGTPATTVAQDVAYSFIPTASDVDVGDVLTFSITNKPTWASFNTATGALTGTPTNTDTGTTTDIVISVSDGTLSASLAAFNLEVTNVNDAPVISGTPITSVNQDVAYSFIPTASDVDVSDVLTFSITNKPTWASFDTATGALTGTPAGTDSGVTTGIVISVSDGTLSASLPAFNLEVVSTVDPLQPIVTAPAAINVNATALFTPISLRQLLGLAATATQAQVDQALKSLAADGVNGNNCCTVMAEGLQPGNVLLVRPGHHLLKWKATNAAGVTGEASQVVNVKPLVSLSKSQVAVRGSTVEFRVLLNGPSPVYPLSIPYVVDASSTATTQEHNLVSGTATFTQPGQVEVVVPVSLAAVTGFSDSQLVVALGDGINAGASKRHVIDIRQGNVPPIVTLSITQGGFNTSLITPSGGPVTVTATVTDLNPGDTHSFDWSATTGLADTDGNPTNAVRVFSPAGLNGSNQVKVTVTDSGGASVQASAYFRVVSVLPVLSPNTDTDQDGIDDDLEGTGDSDDNGIPDYLDNMPSTNILPQQGNTTNSYLIECDPGVRCGLGLFARTSTSGGVQILNDELGTIPNIELDKVFEPVGGVFDFAIRDLPTPGQAVRVVVPQRAAIPANATYRKFQRGRWVSFVVDADNTIHSAAGNPGYCPPPGSDDWTPGLTAGHLCVQLTIKDGGPNDDDGLVNSAVVDPGAVSVALEIPEPPEPPKPPVEIKTDGGGGSIQGLWVLLLGGLLMVKRVFTKGKAGKMIAVLLGVATVLASIATQAATGPYVRVDVANVSSSQREEDFTAALAAANYDLIVYRYDTNRTGYQLALGYQWDQHASTEIGYLDLGKVEVDLTVAGETNLGTIPWHIGQEYPLSPEGFTLVQGLTLNPADKFRIIGEIGIFIWRSEVDVENDVISIKRDRGEDPVVGVRFELPVQEQFGLGLGVRRIYFDTQEADLVSLTGTFRF